MNTCRVHVLAANDRPFSTITWTIGEHVPQEAYERFKDANGDLYVLVYYEDGSPKPHIVLRDAWYQAKRAFDRRKAARQ